MDFYEAFTRPENGRERRPAKHGRLRRDHDLAANFGDFTCRHCARPVSAERGRAGVNHRNHCPYCLWSRHVDLHTAGDRLAACKAPMQPVGVTFKPAAKRYPNGQPGELMLAHQCAGCGALSINRIAADDLADVLWAVFEASLALPAGLRAAAGAQGIALAGAAQAGWVRARLFGAGE